MCQEGRKTSVRTTEQMRRHAGGLGWPLAALIDVGTELSESIRRRPPAGFEPAWPVARFGLPRGSVPAAPLPVVLQIADVSRDSQGADAREQPERNGAIC
jgi:hypothetical protein